MAYTHSGAASQLAVGFGWSVPLCGTYGVWGIAVSCVRCTMTCMCALRHMELRCVLEGHVYMKPTASCEAAQLWAYAYTPHMFPEEGLTLLNGAAYTLTEGFLLLT